MIKKYLGIEMLLNSTLSLLAIQYSKDQQCKNYSQLSYYLHIYLCIGEEI